MYILYFFITSLLGSSFSSVSLTVDQEILLIICPPLSNSTFICQPADSAGELETMMEQLQQHSSTSSTVDLANLAIDQPVSARKDSGGEWCRAQVLDIDTEHSEARVRFVDFGQTETISASQICTLSSQFLSLPKQAITCLLKPPLETDTAEEEGGDDQMQIGELMWEDLKSCGWRGVAKVVSVAESRCIEVVLSSNSGRTIAAELSI